MGGDRQPVRGRGAGPPRADLDASPATTTRWSCVEELAPGTARRTRSAGRRAGLAAAGLDAPAAAGSARSAPGAAVRLAFGSCRYATPTRSATTASSTPTRWTRYAQQDGRPPEDRVARRAGAARRPGLRRRDLRRAPGGGSAQRRDITDRAGRRRSRDFEEYTWLYDESWTRPAGALAAVHACRRSMIFDDHDVRDDWNTSDAWRQDMQATAGGRSGSSAACPRTGSTSTWATSSPPSWPRTSSTSRCARHDGDAEPLLREFAAAADREADGAQGRALVVPARLRAVRLLVIDSRCGRMLDERRPAMVDRRGVRAGSRSRSHGDYDHLLIGTSLPWLLPRACTTSSRWNERSPTGTRGPRLARLGEKLRRAADFEHWAAFRDSFDRLAELIGGSAAASTPAGGTAPPICVLSGDVHHAYVARAQLPRARDVEGLPADLLAAAQLRAGFMKVVFRISWSRCRAGHAVPAGPGVQAAADDAGVGTPARSLLRGPDRDAHHGRPVGQGAVRAGRGRPAGGRQPHDRVRPSPELSGLTGAGRAGLRGG